MNRHARRHAKKIARISKRRLNGELSRQHSGESMNETDILAKVGKLQIEKDNLQAGYDQVLKVLAEVVSGECDTSRILVNLTEGIYQWVVAGERPATPATINGLPHIVVDLRVSRDDLEKENAMLTAENERLTKLVGVQSGNEVFVTKSD